MDPLIALLHLLNFVAPALGVAALLGVALWLQAPSQGLPRLVRSLAWLAGSGAVVLLAGLAWWGRDGKMATYAALVLVMGSVAARLARR